MRNVGVSLEPKLRETLIKVFRDNAPGSKPCQQLQDYAACYGEQHLASRLSSSAVPASSVGGPPNPLARKHYASYFAKNFKDVLRQCELYGAEHRTAMNQTPLMAAASAGNVALIEALLERGGACCARAVATRLGGATSCGGGTGAAACPAATSIGVPDSFAGTEIGR